VDQFQNHKYINQRVHLLRCAVGCGDRFSMGIVALLATKFMLFVAGLVYGIMAAMHIADNVVTTDGDEGKIQVNGIINYVNSITPWYEAALVLLILVLLGWSVYLIKNRQE
jgi:C4-dicarboxylate transporter